jgi:ferredoxin-NADP reductase
MYRLVLYGLILIATVALVLSAGGVLSISFAAMATSLTVLIATSYGASRLFAWIFSTKHNRESWLITALILFFLLLPASNGKGLLATVIVAVLAVASKYVIAFRQRHLFNPAAIALVISGLLGLVHAGWWIGTSYLLPVVVIVGLLIVWKIRHFMMVTVAIGTGVLTTVVVAITHHYPLSEMMSLLFLSGPIIFAATIMLTEPFTTPPTKKWQLIYAALVGFLMTCQLAPFLTPELAIVIGNVLVFIIGQKGAHVLEFVEVKAIAPRTVEVVMRPIRRFTFTPGQYLELSLPHAKVDARGMRRTFSIASGPEDEYVRFGLTVSDPGSSFKQALINLKKGDVVRSTRLGGDFTLPTNANTPLLLIAGGIGITPFRSMLDDLVRRKETRDIVLIYGARSEESLVYGELIESAKRTLKLECIPVISEATPSWGGEAGIITVDTISRHVPDITTRKIYISGPSLMVEGLHDQLIKSGIKRNHIVKDYFSGY